MAPIVRDYTVILTPESEAGGYKVTVPALPEVATQGDPILPMCNRSKNAFASRSKPRKNP